MNTKTLLIAFFLLAANSGICEAQIVSSGMVAYYPFSGNTYDSTSNHYDMTDSGLSYSTDRFGRPSHAGLFNGAAYAKRPFFNFPDSLSVSFWAKTTVTPQNALVVANGNSGSDGIGVTMCNYSVFNTPGNKMVLYMGNVAYLPNPYNADTNWAHYVFTYKNGVAKYYVNDSLRSTSSTTALPPSTYFIAGATWNTSTTIYNHYFQGLIDDIRVYNRVLDSVEVDSLYNESICGPVTLQPVDTTTNLGGNAKFFVASTSYSPNYQWQELMGSSFVNLTNTPPYSGVTTDTLTLTGVSMSIDASRYRCVISNTFCTDSSDVAKLAVHNTTEVNSIISEDLVSVYPNPAHSFVSVKLTGVQRSGTIQLLNELGQNLSEKNIHANNTSFDLSKLPTGLYTLKVTVDGQVFYKKIFKN